MRPRAPRPSRLLRGALLAGALGAALSLGGPDALVPFKLMAASAVSDVYVAVVVDFGNGTVTTHCVPVAPGESDEQALSAVYPVDSNSSGLICDINDVPTDDTSECLESNGSGEFYFWSYWQGSGDSWQYSSVGPGSVRDSEDGHVEGWRFQDPGPDNSSAGAPRGTPSYAAICGAETSTTVPRPPPPVTTTTAVHARATSTSSPAGAASTTTTTGHSITTTTTSRPETTVARPTKKRPAAALADATPRSGGAPIAPFALVGGIIVLLAVLGYWQWRRRVAEE